MKLMLVVIIIITILCVILGFGVSKLYDYMKHKEDKNNIHKQNKALIRENELKVEKIKSQIKTNEGIIKILEDSIVYKGVAEDLQEEVNQLNKLLEDIEGEKINE
ncbi:hypothetical protein [Mammaliicoccus sciuri]|uniref:hypothetical protein n=1 Tax=Mammaliicoccus sciuri TaxID=1296 RepID=UPI002B25D002|nr:hypothetical protein [Mammaliicoccus sciuri]WQK75299.1 hypothetical protein P3U33_06075 [Mammaliicoccus sciuri]